MDGISSSAFQKSGPLRYRPSVISKDDRYSLFFFFRFRYFDLHIWDNDTMPNPDPIVFGKPRNTKPGSHRDSKSERAVMRNRFRGGNRAFPKPRTRFGWWLSRKTLGAGLEAFPGAGPSLLRRDAIIVIIIIIIKTVSKLDERQTNRTGFRYRGAPSVHPKRRAGGERGKKIRPTDRYHATGGVPRG